MSKFYFFSSSDSELKIEGDRQSPRVYIPCPRSILQNTLMMEPTSDSTANVTFSLIPVMFNIGINEKQEIHGKKSFWGWQFKISIDKLNRPCPLMNQINNYSLNRLYRWVETHSPDRNVLVNGYLSNVRKKNLNNN